MRVKYSFKLQPNEQDSQDVVAIKLKNYNSIKETCTVSASQLKDFQRAD